MLKRNVLGGINYGWIYYCSSVGGVDERTGSV